MSSCLSFHIITMWSENNKICASVTYCISNVIVMITLSIFFLLGVFVMQVNSLYQDFAGNWCNLPHSEALWFFWRRLYGHLNALLSRNECNEIGFGSKPKRSEWGWWRSCLKVYFRCWTPKLKSWRRNIFMIFMLTFINVLLIYDSLFISNVQFGIAASKLLSAISGLMFIRALSSNFVLRQSHRIMHSFGIPMV